MAASTITRDTWTNDTGTAANPNADGTVINNAALQNNIYARVDELFSGAGSYVTLTLGGKLSVEGGQITFPATQNASTGANVLDDYEEGSWTPALIGSGGATGQSYTTQVGRYNKIGSAVTAWFDVTLSAKGTMSGAGVYVSGLPFNSENTVGLNGTVVISYFDNVATNFVTVGGLLSLNANTALLYVQTAASTATTVMAIADITNTTTIIGMVIYRASA
jgi:hypothetical protein